jgi:hypothetical protein
MLRELLEMPLPTQGQHTRAILAIPAELGAPTAFARALQTVLSQSGLFYESHLHAWINGRRELAAVREEPQARLSRPHNAASETGEPAASRDAPVPSDSEPRGAILAEALPLVQKQLETLDSGLGQWRIEVWPGQVAALTIEAKPHSEAHEAQPTCSAILKLTLAELGELRIAISLRDRQTEIAVFAQHESSSTALTTALPLLDAALDAADLRLTRAEVRHAQP